MKTQTKHVDTNLFTEEEVALFLTRYENGYNIPQKRYVEWLQMHDPSEAQKLLMLLSMCLICYNIVITPSIMHGVFFFFF